ncbi:DUF4271 domain-containing protein [Flavilitoribacter nigricans]|uniref:DUF4271 domain-containing protein n=1 Tax=Flavilitoribacter nigricans (strain ATCC 23147 / DSM 23189 / NBRC 102662 / NCIMB 1420 / SS-2) TaxID=1122177 RepID=A0A2D0NB03_FLAN2|nr:DUF4271 domain-containing protein [Flavilitoribacter nigricans]PHN05540.1 hypothetical protein CRP01_16235 [Flavilitoribacter nigricans DSM 23189 = NBRC 102662]
MLKVSRRLTSFLTFFVLTAAVVLATGGGLRAQGEGNPFDIKPRLGQMPESTGPAAADVPTGNPFDIIAPDSADTLAAGESPQLDLGGPDVLTAPEPLEGFILGLMLFSFLLLAILVTLFRPYFQKVLSSIGNDNLLSQAHREYQQGQQFPYIVLYLTFMINAGIFLFLLIRRFYELPVAYGNWTLLLLCIGSIVGIFVFKHLLLFFIGRVFPVQKEINVYSFTIMVFGIFIGIALFLGNVALGLAAENLLRPILWVIAGFIGLVYLVRSVRGLLIGSRFIPLHIFHFLLYICTAEIAPVAVVVKLIMKQL